MRPLQRLVGLVLMVLVAAACATSGRAPTSPFLNPEPGVRFRYGAFCGAGIPETLRDIPRDDRQSRLRALAAVAPVDDLDRYCKAHDMCYEHLGHDSAACDQMMRVALDVDPAMFEGASALTRYNRSGVVSLGVRSRLNSAEISEDERVGLRCVNLAREMNLGVNLIKEGRLGEAVELANQAMFTMVDAYGFPTVGECTLDPYHRGQRDTVASAVASAFAAGGRCPRERNGRYTCLPTPAERVLGTGPEMTVTVARILNPEPLAAP